MFKTLKIMAAISLLAFSLAACAKVPAGNVGVKVYTLGGSKGVDAEEVPVGRYWLGLNEELYLFQTFTQNYVWTADSRPGSETDESISFQSKEGMNVNADIGISYAIDPTKATEIFQKYRRGLEEVTDTAMRNAVQNAFNEVASTRTVETVYGEGKVDMMAEVTRKVREKFDPIGIHVESIYYIGTLRLPEPVVASINAKNAATQKAQQRQNEIQQSKAEAQKKVEEANGEAQSIRRVADAQAYANQKITESLTPELVKYKMIEKWNGELPKVSGSSGTIFNMSEEDMKSTSKAVEDKTNQ